MLVVADAAGAGEVYVFDLDDRRVASRFTFAGLDDQGADVGGIALGEDSSLYVPDTRGCCVRRFSLFGNEAGCIGRREGAVPRDRRGLLAHPRAVCFDSKERLWVACGDRPWVHGLQIFERDGSFVHSVPAFGRRQRAYGPALGLCRQGSEIWVADAGNNCLQCFRDEGTFMTSFELDATAGRPIAVAVWQERIAVLLSGPVPQVLLFDRNFRPLGPVTLPDDETLSGPSDLQFHDTEGLLVLDRDAERVLCFDPAGRFQQVVFDSQEW